MRYCVLINGPFRKSTRSSLLSIKKHLIDPLNADVYVFTWEQNVPRNPLRNMKKVTDIEQSYNDVSVNHPDRTVIENIEILEPKCVECENLKPIEHYYNDGFAEGFINSAGKDHTPLSTILNTYGMNRAFAIACRSGIHYDMYIKIRPDIEMINTITPTMFNKGPEHIYVSNKSTNNFQISDQLFSANKENYEKIISVYKELSRYFKTDYEELKERYKVNMIGERLMHVHYHEKGLKEKVEIYPKTLYRIL